MWSFRLISLMLISTLESSLNLYIINCGYYINSTRVPRNHPQTDVGSFMVYQSFQAIKNSIPIRDVFIYWKEIEEDNQCDTSFAYYITCTSTTSDNANVISTQRSNTNYVIFNNLSTDIGYTFLVYTSNKHGLSSEHSIINVPSEYDRNLKKLSLTKILNNQNGKFGLSWNNDKKKSNHNYTLFWCEKNPIWQNECKGYINWIHIPGTESSYNITLEDHKKNYYFAISENWKLKDDTNQMITRSSGMIFESCSILSDKFTLDKIEYIHINYITSTSVEMHWKLECSDKVDGVIGYQVQYCPTGSKHSYQCIGFLKRKYIELQSDDEEKDANYNITIYGDITALVIGDLQPETTYMLSIYADSYKILGIRSYPILVTTLKPGTILNISDTLYDRLGEFNLNPLF